MALWKERGGWRFKFQFRGKKYRGSIYPTRAAALAAQEELKKKVRSLYPKTPIDISFSQIANLYLDWSKRRHAKKTYEYKAMVFRNFLEFIGDIRISELTPLQIQSYLNSRPSNHNYNAHRKELNALFSWASKVLRKETGINFYNPCQDIEKLPEKKPEKIIPTIDEINKLISAAGEEERNLLILIINTMARIDEILRLKWNDIDFPNKLIRLWSRKLSDSSWHYDYIPMNEISYKLLKEMYDKRIQDEWVFYNRKTQSRYNRRPKLMKSLCKKAGIRNIGFHSLRHFGATYLAHCGISKITISALLRHRSLGTTEIYLHSIDDARRMAIKEFEQIFCGVSNGADKI